MYVIGERHLFQNVCNNIRIEISQMNINIGLVKKLGFIHTMEITQL